MNKLQLLNKNELLSFIILAKKNTYASNKKPLPSRSILSKDYIFIQDNFCYQDQYFGKYLDVGREIIWYKEIPVWGMGYRGGIFLQYLSRVKSVFSFLKRALLQPEPSIPVRGPFIYKEDNFKYNLSVNGSITSFTGKEVIYVDDYLVYSRDILGGVIYGKYNLAFKLV